MRKIILRYSLLLILFSALLSLFVPNVFAESISAPTTIEAYSPIPIQYAGFSNDCYVFKLYDRDARQYILPPSNQLASPCLQGPEIYFSSKGLPPTGSLSFDGLNVGNYNLTLYKNECGLFAISCSLSQKTFLLLQIITGSITPTPPTVQPINPSQILISSIPTRAPTPIPPPLPCAPGRFVGGKCEAVDTGLGIVIETEPAKFVKSIFGIILSLSGGVALLLIILSGYKLMLSQGNPEKAQEAKETLTAAIVGLLFIIFSLVILQVIGVDILKIPDFKK